MGIVDEFRVGSEYVVDVGGASLDTYWHVHGFEDDA